ncbi:MAG: hypothetical protein JO051_10245 [Acidobacteriaceae bacterium]|nr:hypothetical protein [Acidobacteriaceae bacterium]
MSDCDQPSKPLLARFRGLLGRRSRAVCLGALLVGGAFGGMPIRPEEIEEHMSSMSKAQIVQVLEQEHTPDGDPPHSEVRAELAAQPLMRAVDEQELFLLHC